MNAEPTEPVESCRECGCTEEEACLLIGDEQVESTCGWAEPNLCTACTPGASERWRHPAEQKKLRGAAA